jgi:hypothetical protein
LEGGKLFHVLNGISLHGGLVTSWVVSQMRAENTVQNLIAHWKEFGFPDYAQFDNATIFGSVLDLLKEVLLSEVPSIYYQSYFYFMHSFCF